MAGLISFCPGIHFVPHNHAAIRERFGKFCEVLKPGLHFINPLMDNLSETRLKISENDRKIQESENRVFEDLVKKVGVAGAVPMYFSKKLEKLPESCKLVVVPVDFKGMLKVS